MLMLKGPFQLYGYQKQPPCNSFEENKVVMTCEAAGFSVYVSSWKTYQNALFSVLTTISIEIIFVWKKKKKKKKIGINAKSVIIANSSVV